MEEYRDRRVEWLPTLRSFLLALIAGALTIALGIFLFAPAESLRMVSPLMLALSAGLSLLAYRAGRIELGRGILTYGALAVIATAMLLGGVRSAAVLIIAPLVITASVISPSTGRRMLLLSGALLVAIGLAEHLQWLPAAAAMPVGLHWLATVVVLVMAAGIGRYLNILLHARTDNERSIAAQLEREKAALAAREKQLRMIAENIPAFIFQGGRDLRCRFANRRYAEFFGFTPENIVGKSVADILGEASAQAIRPRLEAVLSGEVVRYRAVRRSAVDGAEYHLDISFVPERSEAGEVVGFYALKLDVTAEVRAEQSLRKSEELLRLATDGGSVGIWEWDIASGALSWNPQLKRIFGLSVDSSGLTLERFVAAIHAEDRDRVEHAFRSALERNTEFDCEYRIVRPDGGVRWIIARGHGDYNEAGQARRMVGMAIDSTELRLSEAALRVSEARLKEAQRIGHVGSWDLDLVSNRLLWSDEIYRIYGREPGSFGGTFEDLLKLVHPDDLATIRRAFRESAQARGGYEIDHRILTPGGKVKHLRVHWEVFFDADGKPVRALGTARDITEQTLARQEIQRLNADLERRVQERTAELTAANRELESFAYSISHDLRAPLRGIDGFGQLLLEEYGGRLDEQGQDYLRRMRGAAQRMGTLIDDILELSRVSRKSMGRETVDLSRIAFDILENKAKSAPQREVEFAIAPGCKATGDPQLLRVLMENLLENAWKYTRTQPHARIEFGQERIGDETAYFVRDNGVGFDMHYAGRLFSPFQRLHKPEEFEGTGIGLASAARVVHRHGGRIWAESQPERGATFRFSLAGGEATASA